MQPVTRLRLPEIAVFDRTWVLLAALALVLAGSSNVVAGLALLLGGRLATTPTPFAAPPVWGWALLLVGVAQAVSCLGLFAHRSWAGSLGLLAAVTTMLLYTLLLLALPAVAAPLIGLGALAIAGLLGRGPRST